MLREYLTAVRDDMKETAERQAIALYGLASLGDPVLLQLQSLSTAPDLSLEIRPFIRAQNQRRDRAPHCIRHDLAPTTQVKAKTYNDMNFSSR